MEYSGTAVVPSNWLECDGRAVSRTDYSELLGIIGVTYGIGDALYTFNIPDRRGRVAVGIDSNNSTGGLVTTATSPTIILGQTFGEERHKLTIQEMPKHNHGIQFYTSGHGQEVPVVFVGDKNVLRHPNDIGGDRPHNIMQPSIFMKFYIRAK